MTLSETLLSILTADAAFVALAASRVFPVQIPANVLAPLVIYFPVSGSGYPTHDDAATDPITDLKTTQIQFSALAHNRPTAAAVIAALHTALHLGQSGSGTGYRLTGYTGPRETYESGANLHRADLDLTFMHHLSV